MIAHPRVAGAAAIESHADTVKPLGVFSSGANGTSNIVPPVMSAAPAKWPPANAGHAWLRTGQAPS